MTPAVQAAVSQRIRRTARLADSSARRISITADSVHIIPPPLQNQVTPEAKARSAATTTSKPCSKSVPPVPRFMGLPCTYVPSVLAVDMETCTGRKVPIASPALVRAYDAALDWTESEEWRRASSMLRHFPVEIRTS